MNHVRTAMLMAVMASLFAAAGFFIGGVTGMLIAFGIAVAMNAWAYWNADKAVLRMYGAKQVDAQTGGDYFAMVEALAKGAGMPVPKVFSIENPQPNAFATGRNPENAAVAATTGLLKTLTREEIAGVMAHELAHIKNRDTLTMTVTATIAGAIGMLANFGMFFGSSDSRNNPLGVIGVLAVAILAPLAAMLVQMAISRSREYEADRVGAEIAGRPDWLASALAKISGAAARIDNHAAERNPATAHMFIINPLHAHAADSLFSTHPATQNRIAALMAQAEGMGLSASPARAEAPPPSGPWGPRRKGPWG